MDPTLLLRTVESLRSNFESLRRFDPIPALMAESPPGHKKDFVVARGCPSPPVHPWNEAEARWLGASAVLEGGKPIASRDLWVAGPARATKRLVLAAEAAAGFATVLRETVGIPKYSRARSLRDQWFWTVFEVAAAKPPYSVLRLKDGGVFRMADGGIVRSLESHLEEIRTNGPPAEPVTAALLCRDYSPVRYWELKDFTEASLWALDLVAIALPAAIDLERGRDGGPAADRLGEPEGSTPRGETTCERLRRLHKEDPDFAESISIRKLADKIDRSTAAIHESHYYKTVLKPKRAEIAVNKKTVNKAQKWGHFDSVGRTDEDSENH
jgi:hypothetical protein